MVRFFKIRKPVKKGTVKKKAFVKEADDKLVHQGGKVALTTVEKEIRERLSALGYIKPDERRGTRYTGEQLAEKEIRPIVSEFLGLGGEVSAAFEKNMDERSEQEQALLVKALPAGKVMKLLDSGSGIKDPFVRGGLSALKADTQIIMMDKGLLGPKYKQRRKPSGAERIPRYA